MTQSEISKYIDIPYTTLNDWKQKGSNRNKLYKLLINLDRNIVENILNKQTNHRFFHILNRNIDSEKFTFEEIKKAFSKNDYHSGTIREQTIYSKFFKELEVDELEDFIKVFSVSKRDIKKIYISSPFRILEGVSKKWDKRFRIAKINKRLENINKIPNTLQNILNKKSFKNV